MDFDRTLFDTDKFVEQLWKFIAEEYGAEAANCKEDAKKYFQYCGDLYNYNFFGHLAAIDAISDSLAVFSAKARAKLADEFMYEDAYAIIEKIDTILSFGNTPYQEFKLSFCPELSSTPRTLVLEPKGDYIKRHYGSTPTLLVDDKAIADEIHKPALFVQIDRDQPEPIAVKEGHWVINYLDAVSGILDQYN